MSTAVAARPRNTGRPPTVAFRTWLDGLNWRQGQHITLLGTTGSGKTLVARRLLEARSFVVVLQVKRHDDSLRTFRGYRRVTAWPPPKDADRVILHAQLESLDDVAEQRVVVRDALLGIYREGGWALFADELPYIASTLRLQTELETLWQQGRSSGVSVVAAAQRPFAVPQAALSQPTHLLIWPTTDDRDLKRLGEIGGGLDKRRIARALSTLPRHAFLHVDTAEGRLAVSKMPLTTGR